MLVYRAESVQRPWFRLFPEHGPCEFRAHILKSSFFLILDIFPTLLSIAIWRHCAIQEDQDHDYRKRYQFDIVKGVKELQQTVVVDVHISLFLTYLVLIFWCLMSWWRSKDQGPHICKSGSDGVSKGARETDGERGPKDTCLGNPRKPKPPRFIAS